MQYTPAQCFCTISGPGKMQAMPNILKPTHLQIHLRVPVRVVEHHNVCSGQVDAQATGARGQQEDELLRVGRVERVDAVLTVLARGVAVNAAVLVLPVRLVGRAVGWAGQVRNRMAGWRRVVVGWACCFWGSSKCIQAEPAWRTGTAALYCGWAAVHPPVQAVVLQAVQHTCHLWADGEAGGQCRFGPSPTHTITLDRLAGPHVGGLCIAR